MSSPTRLLVLAGVVALANGPARHLPAAEAAPGPVDCAVAANADFALNLYQELSKEKASRGKNLFFSPYSMSGVLAMAAEGARGETAAEMGKVLCFPSAARRTGEEARSIPWNVALIHAGMAELSARFNASKAGDDPKLREKIEGLRKQIQEAKARLFDMEGTPLWQGPEWREAVAKLNKLVDELNMLAPKCELRVANALWAEKTYPFRQAYLNTIRKFYTEGGTFPVDFQSQPEQARLQINAWVEKQTRDRIKDLVPKRAVDSLTRLVLTNAIYFKGEWAEPFWEGETREDDFLLSDGSKTRAPLMRQSLDSGGYAAFNSDGTLFDTPQEIESGEQSSPKCYPDKNGFEMLEMPYKGDDLAMVIVVPRSAARLPALETLVTSAKLQNWTARLQKRSVHVCMPKFRLETAYTMNDALKAMGMVRAFLNPAESPKAADFSGMCATESPPLEQRLYIAAVIHKAFVEVDEKATEAAAATFAGMGAMGLPAKVPFVPTFRADKPFLFLIRDKHTGCLLFLGRVTNPKE